MFSNLFLFSNIKYPNFHLYILKGTFVEGPQCKYKPL